MRLELPDEAATRALAEALAGVLPRGQVLVLKGPLGAGKTTLVRHLARALGFTGRVTSPTYTLMHPYPTPKGTLLHVDLYRLGDPEAAALLGLEEAMEGAYLTAIEWGEPDWFPGAVVIELTPKSETAREALITAPDPELTARLSARLRRGESP